MTAPNSLTIQLNSLNSSVIAGYEKVLTDNIFNSNPTLHYLFKKQKKYDGGAVITEPMIYDSVEAEEYTGAKILNTDDFDPITRGTWVPSYHSVRVVMTDTDDLENSGKAAVFDLLETKYQVAEESLMAWLTTSLWRASSVGYRMWSIREVVKTTVNSNPARGPYGDIDISATANAWYRNVAFENMAATTGALTFANLQTLWGRCKTGVGKNTGLPDHAITTQAIYDRLWALADARQQLGNEYVKTNIGMPSIDFNGCPIMVDDAAPALEFRFLNSNKLFLKSHSRSFFKSTGWVTPSNQHLSIKHIKYAGQLICNEKRGMGVGTITA